ncbi:MAG: hypothetical protein R2851_08360 [Caldilineaceae bacterium]
MGDAYADSVAAAIQDAGFAMPMMCCSPDFTNRMRTHASALVEHEAEMIRITRRMGGPARSAVCSPANGTRR